MLAQLNGVIAETETHRNCVMPRIGPGHAAFPGGIFTLLQDPGNSDAVRTRVVSIDNSDPTAKWSKALFDRLNIPKAALTPWNALGAYGERRTIAAINENVPLCQQIIDIARPVVLVAQGRWAQQMADRLFFAGQVFRVPHPSRRGRASYRGAARDIEDAFLAASRAL